MKFIPGHVYHVYNQGNNKETIFYTQDDYITFLRLYKREFELFAETIAWCLMPNHFHFMLGTDERCAALVRQGGNITDPVTNAVRKLLSSYARILNSRTGRTGSLFRQKTKAKCLTERPQNNWGHLGQLDYCSNCFRYIHENPLKAGLVNRLEDWPYSSYLDYAGLRNGSLCNKDLAVRYCNYQPGQFGGYMGKRFER